MKTKIKHKGVLLTLITVLFFLGSCEDMLNTDSSRIAFEDVIQLQVAQRFNLFCDRYTLTASKGGRTLCVTW